MPSLRKNWYPSGVPYSGSNESFFVYIFGFNFGNAPKKRKLCASRNAPLCRQSSPSKKSMTGACGLTAFSAGWASIIPHAA